MQKAIKKYRKGRRTFTIPINGRQKFEIENLDSSSRYVRVLLFSSRFVMEESDRAGFDKYEFSTYLDSDSSIVFTISDRGHVDEKRQLLSRNFEGVLRIFVSRKEAVEGTRGIESHGIPDILITSEPETESYRQFRKKKERDARWFGFEDVEDPLNYILSVEPLDDEKYGSRYPESVTIQKLTTDQKSVNLIKERNYETQLLAQEMRQKKAQEERKLRGEPSEKSVEIVEVSSEEEESEEEEDVKSIREKPKTEEALKTEISHHKPQKEKKTRNKRSNKKKCVIS
ncbi:unnamed protein product [Caenorhabditis brenneri]